jgi:phosphoserine phosphatase
MFSVMRDFRGKAAIFDLDHSTLDGNAGLLFTRSLYLKGMFSPAIRKQIPGLVYRYMAGKATEADVVEFGSHCQDGLTVEEVQKVAAACFVQSVKPRITREGLQSIRFHLLSGHLVILASGSPMPIVEETGVFLGAHVVIATRAKMLDGRYIAEIEKPLSFEEGKKELVLGSLQRYGISPEEACLYSDSPADKPLFEAIGKPILINPPKEFAQEGRERGWEVRQWKTRISAQRTPDSFDALLHPALDPIAPLD